MASDKTTYWLNLFTGLTWKEFKEAGANISGFREHRRKIASQVKPGDVLLCYMTGVMRWVGALEVIERAKERHEIWTDETFPVQFEVKPLLMLEPETGVPMAHLEGKVSFYEGEQDAGKFKAFVRGSPNRFKDPKDALLILNLMQAAEADPVERPVNQTKLNRKPYYVAEQQVGKKKVKTTVSIPGPEDEGEEETATQRAGGDKTAAPTEHTTIQGNLLRLAAEMGLDCWVARNDRSRLFDGQPLGSMPGIVEELPTQFNEATQETIELIDVLWLKGNSIVAAFEIECTTSVYSGLLRMSDLMALQPNLDIKLYIVAPDDRRNKVDREIKRPTFRLRPKPLNTICGFLPFSTLMEKVEGIRMLGIAGSLSPSFLERTAEYFDVEE